MKPWVERIYNGVVKENPSLCTDAWYVSDAGSYHVGFQWYRYGTFHDGGTDRIQPDHFTGS